MPLSISAVAQKFGLRTSALRYYERVGLLPSVPRSAGRRQYDRALIQRLSVIERARKTGFSIEEIRELFDGFPASAPPTERWRRLSAKKLAQLQETMERLAATQEVLRRMARCQCSSLAMCGERFLAHRTDTNEVTSQRQGERD
jgi:MerR family transcriptional regulator, redox-sensitive transcriptional activator SoxR